MKQPRVWETEWLEHELQERGIWDKLHHRIVDCGSGDGEYCSNSKLFIKKYGWSALLIDGRSDNLALSSVFYDRERQRVRHVNSILSDKQEKVNFENNEHHWALSKVVDYPTGTTRTAHPLSFWLKKFNNLHIGILSLDIEGNESKVLTDLMNNEIYPQVIIVEGNDFETMQEHRRILDDKYGYPIGGILPNQFFVLKELK